MAANDKNKVPPVDYMSGMSGVKRTAPTIMCVWILLLAVYVSFLYLFRDELTVFGLAPADEYCSNTINSKHCNRADLFAFQVSSGIALTICAMVGVWSWHVSQRTHKILPQTPEGRLFGYLPEAEMLAAVNFGFQTFDFVVSLFIPEHATPIMLAHHLMAATVAWCSIRYHLLQYYGIFFLGLTEVSSIFLVFLDLSNFYPAQSETGFDRIVQLCGPCFVLGFIYYRVILWWPESYRLLRDVQSVVRSGRAHQLRPGATWVLYLFLALNLPLGVLQLYWMTLILSEVRKTLRPDQIAL